MNALYTSAEGRTFEFNDHVCIEMLMGVPDEKRTGRLVQVRCGVGAFGSDVYFLRLRDGSLMTFHNVMLRMARDERFEFAFYTSNGRKPPVIPDQPADPGDDLETEYSIQKKWPEVGFLIEQPRQPKSAINSFAMIVTTAERSHEL